MKAKNKTNSSSNQASKPPIDKRAQMDFAMTKKLPEIEVLNPNSTQSINLGQTINMSSK